MNRSAVALLTAACIAVLPSIASATPFDLRHAANFVLLGDNAANAGAGGGAAEIAGNIGVGVDGKLTVSASTLINGNIVFSDTVAPVTQNASLVNSALDALCNHTNSETGACGAGSVYARY
jgi:hypothetical protein